MAFGPYFTHKHETPWGAEPERRRRAVRRRPRVGLPERRAVGPRLPPRRPAAGRHPRDRRLQPRAPRGRGRAPRARHPPGRARDRRVGAERPARSCASRELGGYGCDAAWADDFHHALRVLLTGETEGWYGEFDSIALLAKAFRRPHVHDGTYSDVPPAPLRGARRRRARRSASSSSRPTTTRSATARSATGCRSRRGRSRRSARSCHPSRRCCSRARNTASGRRSSSSPTTSTPRSPTRPARAAGASSPRSPSSPATEVPDPQDPADLRALQADPRGRARGPARPARASCCASAASCCRPAMWTTSTFDERAGWLAVRRGECTLLANFARVAVHVPRERTEEVVLATHEPTLEPGFVVLPAAVGSAGSLMEVWPGAPFPLGATWDGEGTNFSIFSEHAERVELCLFDAERRRDVRRADRAHVVQLALLPAGRARRPALRLPRPRPVRPADRPPLQPGQAAAGPVREVDRGPDPVRQGQRPPVRADGRRGRRPDARRLRRRRRDPEVRRHRPALRLAGRPAAEHAARGQRDLRDARQGLHDAAPGRARGPARHLRGAGLRRRRRLPEGRSASPRSSCCRSTTSPTRRSWPTAG